MLSSYPPGVTGFEPEIAGQDERPWAQEVVCGYTSTGSFSDGNEWDWECSFEGEVEGVLYGDRYSGWTFYWDCPECGQLERNVDVWDLDEGDFE
jgi:hypothetical protein